MGIPISLLVWGTLGVILVYLIVRRVRIRKDEHFEDRDN